MKSNTKAEAAPASGQHTPGPWKFGGTGSCEIYAADGKAICEISFSALMYDGEGTANARLIAAAPALLAALEACAARFAGMRAQCDQAEWDENYSPDDAAWQQARAAIAQAKGVQS